MPVPKRKMSRARTRHRRSSWLRTAAPTIIQCGRCRTDIRPHTVCATCGAYAGRAVLDV